MAAPLKLFFMLSILLAGRVAWADDRIFTRLTVKDGLANSTVYYAMQDSKGYVWLCTETGVNRYDGHHFETFTISNGLADNENFKCFEDSRGRIWFLSYNGKLSYYFEGVIYNATNNPVLKYDSKDAFLYDVKEDKQGTIWFANIWGDVLEVRDKGIITYPLSSMNNSYHYAYSFPVLYLENDSMKKLVVVSDNKTLYSLNLSAKKYTTVGRYKDLQTFTGVRMLNHTDKKSFYYVSDSGLWAYSYKGKPQRIFSLDKGVFSSQMMSFMFDNDEMWIGTSGEGLIRYYYDRSNQAKQYEVFLRGNIITCIFKDKENNIWVSTHGNGIYIIKNNARLFTTLPSELTYSICAMPGKDHPLLIAGCGNGKLLFYENNILIKSIQINQNPFNRILDIIPLKEGKLLIGCDEGVFECDIHTYKVSRADPTMRSYKNADVDPKGNIWICSEGKGLARRSGNLFYQIFGKLKFYKYTAIAAMSDTQFYAGTTNKLYLFYSKSGDYQLVLNDTILRTGIIDLKMVNGLLWVATHGNGIFILKDNKVIKHLTMQKSGIINDICQKLYDDKTRYVWLATNKGLSVLNRHNAALVYNLSSNKGLASDDIKDIVTYDNKVYVATAGGTSIFRLGDINFKAEAPKVYFTSVTRDNRQFIEPGPEVTLDYSRSFTNINFTAITFVAPQDVSYQYKFGNEVAWNPTRFTDISLFGLDPGLHEILLRAKKYNSEWSKPVTLAIMVNPLWFQTTWFRLLVSFLVVLSIYLLLRRRISIIQLRAGEKNAYQRKIIDLESKTLMYQMNPHFIFNSLNTVQQFILEKDEEQGLNYLSDFSVLMRQILQNTSKPSITVSEEIDFLERYLQLERTRFNNKFDYEIKISDDVSAYDTKIPPVFIQPLVENAIKYGNSVTDKKTSITLSLSKVGDFLLCVVEDNGRGIYSKEENNSGYLLKKESTALKLIEERLRLITTPGGKTGKMSIRDKSFLGTNETGTSIEILIPILI